MYRLLQSLQRNHRNNDVGTLIRQRQTRVLYSPDERSNRWRHRVRRKHCSFYGQYWTVGNRHLQV